MLDTECEERFDRITRLAQSLFQVPIALVSLVDCNRQWFKSKCGLDADETPRDISFCGHTIHGNQLMVIKNALDDERFADNPLVTGPPNIRFYCGSPITINGYNIGTLCIIDDKPRDFTAEQEQALQDLTRILEHEFSTVQMATTDELTGVANRRGFHMLAQKALCVAKRNNTPVSLIYCDIDRFKPINDNYGHAMGDAALKAFTAILQENFRDSDTVARMGGDEFCVLCFNSQPFMLPLLVERLQHKLREFNAGEQFPFELAASVGHTTFLPQDITCIDMIIESADSMMYDMKHRHRAA